MKIKNPLIFFDLETTGTSTEHDRIIQIPTHRIDPDGTVENKTRLINPGIPIPPEATAVHGITDEMVQDAPTFKQIAKGLSEYFDGCDFAGYNSNSFEFPMLIQEFHRCSIEFPTGDPVLLDSYLIEKTINSHKLSETFKRYTGKNLEGAHDAGADVEGTVTVLDHQLKIILERFPELLNGEDHITPEMLQTFTQGDKKRFDYAGKCYVDESGAVCWSQGKHYNKPVLTDRGYLNWVLNANFPAETKKKLKELLIKNAE